MMIEGILLPVFLLVAVSFANWLRVSGAGRVGRLFAAEAPAPRDPALQLDVLFYAVIAFALPLRRADLVMVVLAWLFVIVRLAGSGLLRLPSRAGNMPGVAAALVLLAMWVYFALRLLIPL